MTEPYRDVASLDDLPEGEKKLVEVDGKAILLCHTGGQVYAVLNRCSHADQPLDCGRMRRGWIACPAHGARFDLATGQPMNPPATEPIQTFETRLSGGRIEVRLDS